MPDEKRYSDALQDAVRRAVDETPIGLRDELDRANADDFRVTRGEFDAFRQQTLEMLANLSKSVVDLRTAPPKTDHAANIRDIVKNCDDNGDTAEQMQRAVDVYIDGAKRTRRL